jgi:hypothetical protein
LEVVKVSTRGAVAFEVSDGNYRTHYNHFDSYPTWLGVKLAELLKQGKTAGEIIEELDLKDFGETGAINGVFGIEVAKQVFPKLQADLEWVYVVGFSPPSLQIFRTSNPDFIDGPDFVFSAWFSYVEHFPDDIRARMAEVERTAEITLNGLAAYHEAKNSP